MAKRVGVNPEVVHIPERSAEVRGGRETTCVNKGTGHPDRVMVMTRDAEESSEDPTTWDQIGHGHLIDHHCGGTQ